MPGKGVDKLPWSRIPAQWDPVWFARMMREVWALADTRNAIAGDGVVITGTPDVPATISASPDVLNLLLQPYVTASASAFLPNERILTSSARISVTDGGAGGAITPDLVIGSIGSLYLEQQVGWSVFGRSPNTTGYLQSIQATNDGDVLRVSGSYLGFGQVATAGIADAAVTYAKIQNVTATSRFLGRITSGAGVVEELTGAQAFSLIQPSGVALTKTDDTNVTLTLGGSPTTALVNSASLTLGWSGTLAKTRGGWGLDVTTLTGYVKAAGAGSITASATIPYSDITGAPSAVTGANPTASVGLTAVNGSAGTFLRSDGAPALSQSIAPTWTGTHKFTAETSYNSTPGVSVGSANSGANASIMLSTSGAGHATWMYGGTDAGSLTLSNTQTFRTGLSLSSTAGAYTALQYGNSTDNPSHTFYGQINGNGAGLTSLNASNLSSGTVADARLSSNVPLKDAANTFTAAQTISVSGANPGISVSLLAASLSGSGGISYWLGSAVGSGTSGGLVWNNNSGTPFLSVESFADASPLKLGASYFQFRTGGIQVGSPTGGDKGAGTINAAGGIYQNNVAVLTSADVPTLAANTYTPTGTNVTNTSGITALTGMYSRVGNIVTVSGTFTVTTTTIGVTSRVAVSLPVASALSAVTQLAGALACRSTLATALNSCCYADATNDRAEIQFVAPASAAAHDYSFWFQYEVI